MGYEDIISTLAATLRLTTPLLLACLAGLYSERSGIFDIGLEGKMLAAAFGAASVSVVTGNMWLGLLAGILVSIGMAMLHGVASITLKGNQIISGVAINFLAQGLTAVLGLAWFHQGGRTPPPPAGGRFVGIIWPGASDAAGIPIIGPIYSVLISGQNILVYIAFLAVPVTYWVLYRTRLRPPVARRRRKPQGGRYRRHLGGPPALPGADHHRPVVRHRRRLFLDRPGLGLRQQHDSRQGLYRARGVDLFQMAAGAGDVRHTALRLPRCAADSPAGRAHSGIGPIPVQFIQALPYVLTVVLLAGFIGKAVGPKAGGVPYTKER